MNTEQYPIEQYSFDAGDCQPIDTPTPPVGEVKSAEAEKISFTGKSKDDIMQIVNPDKNGMFWTDAMVKECMGMWAMVVIDSTPHKEGYSVEMEKAIALLKGYAEFEAALIEDNALWWPQAMKDAVRGKTYDLMLELQEKRTQFLNQLKK